LFLREKKCGIAKAQGRIRKNDSTKHSIEEKRKKGKSFGHCVMARRGTKRNGLGGTKKATSFKRITATLARSLKERFRWGQQTARPGGRKIKNNQRAGCERVNGQEEKGRGVKAPRRLTILRPQKETSEKSN